MKAKYPGVNLNKAPTLKDLELANTIVRICEDHRMKWACNTLGPQEHLSEKIAQAIKNDRVQRNKHKKGVA